MCFFSFFNYYELLNVFAAHCMGLGKTLQVIAYLHTIMTHPKIKPHIKRVLILCPAGLVPNWAAEFRKWLVDLDRSLDVLKVYEISSTQKLPQREKILNEWFQGDAKVLLMGYGMFFSSLENLKSNLLTSGEQEFNNEFSFISTVLGPNIVVCDEAHRLNADDKKEQQVAAVQKIQTLRRISLTG